jgi:Na+/H+-dicarboxylate symporter
MVLGAILGVVIHNTISAEAALSLVIRLKFCNSLIRLVQMIIAPLVFTTLVWVSWEIAQWVEWRKGLGWFYSLLLSPYY